MIDIGCGEGLYAKILFAEKLDTGIDPDPHELERARALGAYHELIQCHGASVPKSDGTYRTIFSNSVPDLALVRKEAHRLLASGRRFFFTVPSPNFERFTAINLMLDALGLMALSRRFRAFFNRFWMHYHAYPLEAWVALAKEAGFEVIEACTYDPKRICLFNAALTPFALPSKVVKAMTNRWFLLPGLRRMMAGPISVLAATPPARRRARRGWRSRFLSAAEALT
jgi:SAM-dependent methyltransferase